MVTISGLVALGALTPDIMRSISLPSFSTPSEDHGTGTKGEPRDTSRGAI